MLLTSSLYFTFLVAVFLLYWPAARVRALCLGVVLFANYFFYARWDLFYLALIPIASTVDFLVGVALGRFQSTVMRRALVLLSILGNVGVLVAFKYMPFLLENYGNLTGISPPGWHLVFPLGISFYCFQALSYTIDVYRRDAKPVASLLTYLTAASFFPTTLAGPITRPASLAPQLDRPKSLSPTDGGRAFFLIGLGMAKKFLIADYLGENLVNRVFDFPNLYSGFETLIAVYAYAFQLYYDFSGYTNIAIGSALLLGLKLPENFNMPYVARNLADFWRRWHISLSNWLRDYIFFSLPGKRTKWMPYVAIAVTMLIGGLWHGASWNFVLWGALHGAGLMAVHALGRREIPVWAARLITFHFVCFCWIFFRAATLDGALLVLGRISSLSFSVANLTVPLLVVLAIGATAHYLPDRWYQRLRDTFADSPFFVQAAAIMLLMIGLQYIAATGAAPFIYTKF